MSCDKTIELLEEFAKEFPNFSAEVESLCINLKYCGDASCQAIYDAFLRAHHDFKCSLEQFKSKKIAKEAKKLGRYFSVYTVPRHLHERLNIQGDRQMQVWKDTLMSLPLYTSALPQFDKAFIASARRIWRQRVCGNEDVLEVMLSHAAEYCQTGKTTPILLAGPPGIGKSLAAKCYAKLLGLPCVSLSGPNEALNRGLAGDPTVYVGSGPGAIASAMISTGTGSPVILIDELDKAGKQFSNKSSFHSELLSVLDDNSTHWKDNYLEIELDASHIPFVFTANDIELIPQPLLDRMDIIHMHTPDRDTLYSIIKGQAFPELLEIYSCHLIRVSPGTPEALVDKLWDLGCRSCRPYLKATKNLISNSFLIATESESLTTITQADAISAAEKASCIQAGQRRAIGFA